MENVRPLAAIGFVGLGKMGRPMARRLAEAGYVLHVADSDAATVDAFCADHGGRRHERLSELAAAVEVVVTMLPDGGTVRRVVLGDGPDDPASLAAGLKPDALVVDMSSSDPVGTRELGEALARRSLTLVDAPVSGGVKRAEDGSLAVMAGGDAAAIGRIRPLLDHMAGKIFETGPLGSGHAMKALNNMASAAGLWIVGEALLIGQRFGLAPDAMVDVLNASTGRNNSTEVKFHQQILSRAFASGFSISLMAKDLRTAAELAKATDTFSPFTQQCADLWSGAAERLGADADHTAVVRLIEEETGERLHGGAT